MVRALDFGSIGCWFESCLGQLFVNWTGLIESDNCHYLTGTSISGIVVKKTTIQLSSFHSDLAAGSRLNHRLLQNAFEEGGVQKCLGIALAVGWPYPMELVSARIAANQLPE